MRKGIGRTEACCQIGACSRGPSEIGIQTFQFYREFWCKLVFTAYPTSPTEPGRLDTAAFMGCRECIGESCLIVKISHGNAARSVDQNTVPKIPRSSASSGQPVRSNGLRNGKVPERECIWCVDAVRFFCTAHPGKIGFRSHYDVMTNLIVIARLASNIKAARFKRLSTGAIDHRRVDHVEISRRRKLGRGVCYSLAKVSTEINTGIW